MGDDAALLRRIQEADPVAGSRFLEHLVLTKRSLVSHFTAWSVSHSCNRIMVRSVQDPDLHNQLAAYYVDALLACLQDASTSKSWRAKGAYTHPVPYPSSPHTRTH